ncbi:hypothetical protein F2P81_024571 [Scophthalmus maximus]|uniref:Uncharacterized protein n=1 Tax=Scophthalmus maximus TaxID=52904 RepID=A0A6A4RXZ1_SCOMX|nr:hypothetical protein F2P81_024571 [Scophthalmus maximus]
MKSRVYKEPSRRRLFTKRRVERSLRHSAVVVRVYFSHRRNTSSFLRLGPTGLVFADDSGPLSCRQSAAGGKRSVYRRAANASFLISVTKLSVSPQKPLDAVVEKNNVTN